MRRLFFIAFQLLGGLAAVLSAAAQAPTAPPLLARPSPETRPSATVTLTGDERWKFTISHPTPEYPIEARRRHLSGAGVYELRVKDTGEVSSVTVISSTGYPILDGAAIEALKKWRFRPHMTVVRVKVPITFSLPKNVSEPQERTNQAGQEEKR